MPPRHPPPCDAAPVSTAMMVLAWSILNRPDTALESGRALAELILQATDGGEGE